MRLFIAALLLLTTFPVQAAVVIGVAAAARGPIHSTAPGEASRTIETGKPIYAQDHMTTGADARLQILLKDETTFTLGPNSDMILDEFVYDPATSAGRVAATVSKGAFRFVSGKVARRDPKNMKVATPVATIGIRGTMVGGVVKPEQTTIVLIGPGPGNNADENPGGINVGNDKGSVDVDKSGYGVTVAPGQGPSNPFEFTSAQLDAVLGGVASAPKGSGQGPSEGTGGGTDKNSGQSTAEGKKDSVSALAVLDAAQPETIQFASQAANNQNPILDGIGTWDQVRSITTGTGFYAISGTYSGAASGSFTSNIDIDFGNKTLGGGSSNFATSGSLVVSSGINSLSFAALTGDAKTSLLSVLASPGGFTQMDLKLVNAGGVAAKTATLNMAYNSGSQSYTGVGSGSR
jgi:hypothetical protein